MPESQAFEQTLEHFLASNTFLTIVRDDLSQLPEQPRLVALDSDGSYTVYSSRQDAPHKSGILVLEIPQGDIEQASRGLRAALAAAHPPA